jgi:transposase-like protein
MQVQSQRVHEYPTWFRQRVLSSPGSTSALAARWQVSPRSIRRWRQQQRETGSIAPRRRSPGRSSRFGLRELILLAVFKVLFPGTLIILIEKSDETDLFFV